MGDAIGVEVSVGMGVIVGVLVNVLVGVFVSVLVGVRVKVLVGVGMGVRVRVGGGVVGTAVGGTNRGPNGVRVGVNCPSDGVRAVAVTVGVNTSPPQNSPKE